MGSGQTRSKKLTSGGLRIIPSITTVIVVPIGLVVVSIVLTIVAAVPTEFIVLSERVESAARRLNEVLVDLLDGLQCHSTPGRRGQQRAVQRRGKQKRA